jgi:hypothetical protein
LVSCATSLNSLEDVLLHPKIWKGRSGAFDQASVSTGFAELDRLLPGGGWPQGAITEFFVDRAGIGELRLLIPALGTLCGRLTVWIAPPFIPYAPALVRHGLDLSRLLLVFADDVVSALWAAEQALHSQRGITVFAWLRAAGPIDLRRLQLVVEKNASWVVLFRPVTALGQRSSAALQLGLTRQSASLMQVEIFKCRGRKPGVVSLRVPRAERGTSG